MTKLTRQESGSLGGIATREKLTYIYNQNPKECLSCNKKLDYSKKHLKYCNRSCSATHYNNKRAKLKVESFCNNCNKKLSKSSSKFCNARCQKEFQNKENIKQWLSGNHSGGNNGKTNGWIKRYVLEQQEYKCSECGIIDYNNKPINLELDHIDGNPYNNVLNNLRCICPNCHSQSLNYKNRNRGNGRHYRRDRYASGTSY